jgi:nitrogen regulatory protein PII 2
MKEIIAIIRPSKMNATKKILDGLSIPSVTGIPVLGRGAQRGLNTGLSGIDVHPHMLAKGQVSGMKFIPKRMLVIVARDEDTEIIIDALVKANRTGFIGDGKIFVSPTDDAMRISSEERGDAALI